ncbi:MAG: hypothetical protein RL607_969 [Bacteroidota bacterium]|jgi:hypothetical protein
MKKLYFVIALILTASSWAQQQMNVHNSGNVMYTTPISEVENVKLDNTYAKIKLNANSTSLDIQKQVIDYIDFSTTVTNLDKIYIIYNGTDNATIINPYANQGVIITANAGTVTVNATSGIDNLEYNILGSTSNGSLTLTTDKDVNLVLNNVTLTNPSGAAFTLIGGKITNLLLTPNSINTLVDGTASLANGTLTTDGPITVSNTGTLKITGLKKHGINTSSTISINNGTVTVLAATTDGFHSEGYSQSGGTVTITSLSDGIDAGNGAVAISNGSLTITSTAADVKALKTGTNTISFTGGAFNATVSGAQSKAISAKGNITFDGGTFTISLSGATVLVASGTGFDPSYPTGVKSDAIITINNGNFTITTTSTATGAKGFSSNSEIIVNGGTINVTTAGGGANYTNTLGVADSYSTAAFSADTNITINGGTLTLTNTGADGKNISADVNVTIANGNLTLTNSGGAGKGIKADGIIAVNGGTTTINLSGATVLTASGSGNNPGYPTGIKATSQVQINNGTLTIVGTSSATGARGISSDGTISITGGTVNVTLAGNGATYTNTTGVLDSYGAAAITSDTNVSILGGTVTTSCSGTGGKGLKSDGTLTVGSSTSAPTINLTTTGARFLVSGTDYNHPKTMVAVGALVLNNGTTTINSTDDGIHSDASVTVNGGNHTVSAISTVTAMGEGVEAPIITFAGGVTNVTASNDGINCTYGTVSGGTESNDNSHLYVTGGVLIVAGKDAVDSNGNITISGGTSIICGPTSSPEEGFDFNGTFNMNGGTVISAGSNSNMTKNFSATSTQRTMYIKSSAQLAATSLIHIRTAAGVELATFKPKNAVYYFHFSSPNVAGNTSHQIYFGGTYTGGSFVGNSSGWGLYTGGTYSTTGGALKSTFTTSGTSTLNTVTF